MERRRQEEVRKARYNWSLLRNSIKNTITAVKEADTKNVLISHGIHHQRKINLSTELKQVLFIKELDVCCLMFISKFVPLMKLSNRLSNTNIYIFYYFFDTYVFVKHS